MKKLNVAVMALSAGFAYAAPGGATVVWGALAEDPTPEIIDTCYGGEAPGDEEEVNECACNMLGFEWGINGCFS